MTNSIESKIEDQNPVQHESLLTDKVKMCSRSEAKIAVNGNAKATVKLMKSETTGRSLFDTLAETNRTKAAAVQATLNDSWSVPQGRIVSKVADDWVTLEGELPWKFEKEAATRAVKYLKGIKGITNNIKIKSGILNSIEKTDIEAAIARSWSIGENTIVVKVSGTTATLNGRVSSWYQKQEAERIAWITPGIWQVKNELEVDGYQLITP